MSKAKQDELDRRLKSNAEGRMKFYSLEEFEKLFDKNEEE